MNTSGQNHNQHHHSGHDHQHHQANRMDQPSPMNMLWGLILAVLTFLLVVICVLSIHWISKLYGPTDEPADPNPPIDDPIKDEKPIMLPSSSGQSWSPDNADAMLTFVSDAALSDFIQVTINNTALEPSNYMISEGSTIVTLKAEYLQTLAVGNYVIGIHSKNGVASTTFEIKEKTPASVGPGDPNAKPSFIMSKDSNTITMNKKIFAGDVGLYSDYAILVDLDTNSIVADLNGDWRIYPASMTKVLTLLVACENLKEADMNQYVTFTADVITLMQSQNASGIGFKVGEEVRVIDLLYAIALQSDGAASMQLGIYVAGSNEKFVQMMNDKVEELGLLSTHFENATGLHDPNHYTTCREMASIMAAAMANERVKTLLSTEKYETTTNIHGRITFYSTYFVRLYNDIVPFPFFPDNGKIVAAKTGLTDEAGYCLATYMESNSGGRYIAITASANSQLLYVEDYRYIYGKYAK
ncbi:MAG: D-alanyl-D-alanine carboxypeptidase [Ruminococcaceae bacterium]|nr:D-alanyl-D-alanine carboxypeptidase [Oscillospiraceae bacterium]